MWNNFSTKTKQYSPQKKDYKEVPWAELVDPMIEAVQEGPEVFLKQSKVLAKEFALRYGLGSWTYPQLLAHINSSWTPKRVDGKYCGRATAAAIPNEDRGIYFYLMANERTLTKKQYQETEYCAGVPLILSAWKKFAGINYSEWDRDTLHYIVDPLLAESMLTPVGEHTVDELLEARRIGLTQSKGRVMKAESTYGIYTSTGHCLDTYPKLARMMLAQTWCWHPSQYNQYMVTTPDNWDGKQTPLIDTKPSAATPLFELPW